MKKPSSAGKQFAFIAAAAVASAMLWGYNVAMQHHHVQHGAVVPHAATPGAAGAAEPRAIAKPPALAVVAVQKRMLNEQLSLPGQLLSYQDVPLHAKVKGYISSILVDRGSIVHQGQLLATVSAPEINDDVKEAEAKQSAATSSYAQSQSDYQAVIGKQEAEASKLQADELTYKRLVQAAKTPGAIAGNEIDLAHESVAADQGQLDSLKSQLKATANLVAAAKQNVSAVHSVVNAQKAMRSYLDIRAPFDGVITERNVHEGSIVGDKDTPDDLPLLRIQQENPLRLVVALPEADVSGIKLGMKVPFTVPAFPGTVFTGVVARPGYALDDTTRTMPVELNVSNPDRRLTPGMFATVKWDISRPKPSLFLPQSAVSSDLQGTFVLRYEDGAVKRVAVSRGHRMGNLVEVIGAVHTGDLVALSATDEYRNGTRFAGKLATAQQIALACQHTSSASE